MRSLEKGRRRRAGSFLSERLPAPGQASAGCRVAVLNGHGKGAWARCHLGWKGKHDNSQHWLQPPPLEREIGRHCLRGAQGGAPLEAASLWPGLQIDSLY